MSDTSETAGPTCPRCGNVNTAVGGSGNGMCFDCAYIWDPATEVAAPAPVVGPVALASVEEVFGPDDAIDPESYRDAQDELVGGMATLEGGQVAQVVTFTDDDRVVVTLATGDTEVVSLAHVERIVPPAPPPPAEVEPAEVEPPPVEIQAVMLMATQIIDAGVRAACVAATPGLLLDVPTGYLPDDPGLLPIVEQAVAVAVGMVIDATDAAPADVASFFGIDLEETDTGDQQQEVNDGERGNETGE